MVLYANGDYGSFQELYRRHASRVYGYLKSRVPSEKEAEDMLQQVFLKVHQHRSNFDPQLPFIAWVFTIARNVLIDHFRKHRAIPVEESRLNALADRNATGEEHSEVGWKEIVELLPKDQRTLIEQRFEQGLSFEEIASKSGVSAVSVRKRLSRSIQTLRMRLAPGKERK